MTELKPWTEAPMYWSVSARRDVSCFISSTAQGDFNGQRSPLITVIAAPPQSTLIVQQRIIVTLHCGPLTMCRVSWCAPMASAELTAGCDSVTAEHLRDSIIVGTSLEPWGRS